MIWAVADRLLRGITKYCMNAAATILMLTMLALVLNAVMRYGFQSGIPLIIEVSGYVFLWLIFLGLGGTFLEEGHANVDILIGALPSRLKNFLQNIVSPAFTALYVCLVFWAGINITVKLFYRGTTSIGAHPFLLWPVIAVIPIGSLLFLFALIVRLFRPVKLDVPDSTSGISAK